MATEAVADIPPRPEPEQQPARVRWGAIVFGLLLIPPNAYWVAFMEAIRYSGHPTTYSLYFNVVFALCILVALNALLRRALPRLALTQAEMVVVYFMLAIGSSLVGHDQAQVLLSVIAYPHYYATPETGWAKTFIPYLPKHLYLWDDQALKHLYGGASSVWASDNLLPWLGPLGWWSGFTLTLLMVMLGICLVFRQQWAVHEKLSFPLVQLPIAMAEPGVSLWRNRGMWYAMLVPAVINSLSNLHMMYPWVPELHIRQINLNQYVVSRPWNAIGWTPVTFFPFAIGIGFLLPLDLLFSSWFFYLFWKLQYIFVSALGYNTGPALPPYEDAQSFGAYIGIALFVLWAARMHLRKVGRVVGGAHAEEPGETLRLRLSVAVIAAGIICLIWFSLHGGMSLLPAIAFFLMYFAVSVTICRLRGEFGSPVHDLHFADPGYIMTLVCGSQAFDKRTLCMFGTYFWFNRAHRSHPMPILLESVVAVDRLKADRGRVVTAMVLATVLGLGAAYWALLAQYYDLGAGTAKVIAGMQRGFGRRPMNQLHSWFISPTTPSWGAIGFMLGGTLFTALLFWLRIRLITFPFHPVGYAISGTWSMELVWMPLFLAWCAKAAIFRYGGFDVYRRAVPIFLGLIIGDFGSGAIWNICGLLFHWPVYHFLG